MQNKGTLQSKMHTHMHIYKLSIFIYIYKNRIYKETHTHIDFIKIKVITLKVNTEFHKFFIHSSGISTRMI